MSAGEAMRAVGRLTRVPVIPGGIRGMAAEHLPSSSGMPLSVASVSSGEEGSGELTPRVVFNGAPTLEEARVATSELIVGLEMLDPRSHDSDGHQNSVAARHELGSFLSNSQVRPAQASLSGGITMEPSALPTVFTALSLLRESSQAQDVVTSLASDPNMWTAVQENQQLQEFLHWERRRLALSHSVTGAERLGNDSYNYAESNPGISFEDLLKIIKGMVDMVKNLSDIFINLFGGQGELSNAIGDGVLGATAGDAIETSLLGLAIMVIMIIFLKRR